MFLSLLITDSAQDRRLLLIVGLSNQFLGVALEWFVLALHHQIQRPPNQLLLLYHRLASPQRETYQLQYEPYELSSEIYRHRFVTSHEGMNLLISYLLLLVERFVSVH
jgi:hypothetical protein